eukprot:m.34364 g.34364  ORF g.34364 m.34364 type:complete len:318 (-) comp12294_c1_seq1:40-993(-)
MRLDRLVASVAKGMRVMHVKELVEDGRAMVNGAVIIEPAWQVLLPFDEVSLNGEVLPKPFHRLSMLNKPANCLCERLRGGHSWCRSRGLAYESEKAAAERETASNRLMARAHKAQGDFDPERAASAKPVADMTKTELYHYRLRTLTSVYDILPEELDHPKLGAFGRLDRDTTGLYLMGTDGGLQGLMLSPGSKCDKTYRVVLHADHPIADDAEDQFAAGFRLKRGDLCRPGKLERDPNDPLVVRVTIVEGMYHQVKRMIGHVGGYVVELHRERIGEFVLPSDLLPGQARELTAEQQQVLLTMFPATPAIRLLPGNGL